MSDAKKSQDFYKKIPLLEMTDEQWEAVCDGCGLCCFRKFIDGRGKNTRLIYTAVACDCLDLKTGKCRNYGGRFKINRECVHLTKKNVADFKWLPETCAYRLLSENKELPPWHPLLTGKSVYENSVFCSDIKIKNAVNEKDAADWTDFIICEEKYE